MTAYAIPAVESTPSVSVGWARWAVTARLPPPPTREPPRLGGGRRSEAGQAGGSPRPSRPGELYTQSNVRSGSCRRSGVPSTSADTTPSLRSKIVDLALDLTAAMIMFDLDERFFYVRR